MSDGGDDDPEVAGESHDEDEGVEKGEEGDNCRMRGGVGVLHVVVGAWGRRRGVGHGVSEERVEDCAMGLSRVVGAWPSPPPAGAERPRLHEATHRSRGGFSARAAQGFGRFRRRCRPERRTPPPSTTSAVREMPRTDEETTESDAERKSGD